MPEPSSQEEGVVRRDIVVLGASAGGVESLQQVVAALPAELAASIFVVLHVPPSGTSVLPQILARSGPLAATAARDGEPFERGHVYVAPSDHHMLVDDGAIRLTRAPRENGHRPAIDPLFRSVARAHGPRVVGVLLSGANDDGAAGLQAIRRRGGATLAQDPKDALYPAMPAAAVRVDAVDRVLPAAAIAGAIVGLVDTPVAIPDNGGDVDDDPSEPDRADDGHEQGDITGLTCPDCGGALWETREGDLVRFKCHVGHAFSPASLDGEQAQALEMALWAALRSLQERADLFRRLARRQGGSQRFLARAEGCEDHAAVLRRLITTIGREPSADVSDATGR
jgi:two-component system chemotaxis response regulator CheB